MYHSANLAKLFKPLVYASSQSTSHYPHLPCHSSMLNLHNSTSLELQLRQLRQSVNHFELSKVNTFVQVDTCSVSFAAIDRTNILPTTWDA